MTTRTKYYIQMPFVTPISVHSRLLNDVLPQPFNYRYFVARSRKWINVTPCIIYPKQFKPDKLDHLEIRGVIIRVYDRQWWCFHISGRRVAHRIIGTGLDIVPINLTLPTRYSVPPNLGERSRGNLCKSERNRTIKLPDLTVILCLCRGSKAVYRHHGSICESSRESACHHRDYQLRRLWAEYWIIGGTVVNSQIEWCTQIFK